jgi:hypothetical protein
MQTVGPHFADDRHWIHAGSHYCALDFLTCSVMNLIFDSSFRYERRRMFHKPALQQDGVHFHSCRGNGHVHIAPRQIQSRCQGWLRVVGNWQNTGWQHMVGGKVICRKLNVKLLQPGSCLDAVVNRHFVNCSYTPQVNLPPCTEFIVCVRER